MQLQPVHNFILVKKFEIKRDLVVVSNGSDVVQSDTRPRIKAIAVGPEVKRCKAGDFLLLMNKTEMLDVDPAQRHCLIREETVLCITDDTEPE